MFILCIDHVEAEEVGEILANFGVEPTEYRPVVESLRKRPENWVDFMMRSLIFSFPLPLSFMYI